MNWTCLGNISWRVELNCCGSGVELIAVQIKELHEYFTEMMFGDHASALNLGHVLEKTYDETGDRESTDTSIDRFIETSHCKEMLDHCD